MTSLNVPDVLESTVEVSPFLTVKADSGMRSWEGIFAFHNQLNPVEPDLAPTGLLLTESLVLQTAGEPIALSFSDSKRWHKAISTPGRVCFFPRYQPIKVIWSRLVENVAFGVTQELLKQVAMETRAGDPDNFSLYALGIVGDAMLTQIGWTLLGLLHDADTSARLYAEALGVSLAHHLLYHYDTVKLRRTVSMPTTLLQRQLQATVDYIHANYQHNLSLAEIAASAGLSVAHFSRLFRQATGYSPHQYLIRCRVEQAAVLMKQHKYTLADIAQQVGFYDQSHLLRHFRRVYGQDSTL